MAVGSQITTARFNNLQARIENILGNGSGSDGYGQTVQSNQITFGTEILAATMADLYRDMTYARIHQTGVVPSQIAPITSGNVVAEETSFVVEDDGDLLTDPDGTKKGIADFENLMNTITADKFLCADAQATVQSAITSVRTTSWNGKLVHEITVTFDDENHRRHFFNSGGQIRFSANISGGSGDKTNDWRIILQNIKTVYFDYTATYSFGGSGTGSAIGSYELEQGYTPVFSKTGSGAYALYSANSYTIEARAPDYVNSANQGARIQFRITFDDASLDRTVDNDVNGTLTSTVQVRRASGTYVDVDAPNFTNTRVL